MKSVADDLRAQTTAAILQLPLQARIALALSLDLWQSLSSDGLRIDIRRGDADDPLGGVVRVETAGERPVDVILGKLAWQQRAIERAESVAGGPPVVLSRDLILLND